ncbi:MAG: hypothetical protein GY761_17940 [Hyphomicrobiales bacterium]|nr:hypothetical protein [Hyphomicrobiales bacterium]
MSEAKVQDKASTGPPKARTEKAEAGAKAASETSKPADTSSSDTPSVAKADAAPKSASQMSISHFSSVSTPAYKEGWNNIFGQSKFDRTTASNTDNSAHIPEKLTIEDVDIDQELKAALYKAFQRQARAQGISLASIKKQVDFEYILQCNLNKK